MRLGVFVDITNQVQSIQELKKGYRVNYAKYLELIKNENDELVIAVAYGNQASQEFIYVLKKLGYITKFGHLNKDVEIAIDTMILKEKLDTIVLGSNSLDLIPLIHYIQMQGVKVAIVTPNLTHTEGNYAIDLLVEGTTIEYIQDMRASGRENH